MKWSQKRGQDVSTACLRRHFFLTFVTLQCHAAHLHFTLFARWQRRLSKDACAASRKTKRKANKSTSFKFAQEEEPDPKKKPDSKKKKHDPLAGTLIKQHKHSKTDPFAGMKRKKRKQKEAR